MDILNEQELSIVSGSGGMISTLALGVGSTYIYESIGGKETINTYIENSFSSAGSSYRYWTRKFKQLTRPETEDEVEREDP